MCLNQHSTSLTRLGDKLDLLRLRLRFKMFLAEFLHDFETLADISISCTVSFNIHSDSYLFHAITSSKEEEMIGSRAA